ncbi:hypothetical protein POJ06DRAFT_262246 [Lipomyces tetrasporus]|uniref:Uncharacterized protein n=1 Tax=Lipomyces tetrasporus TaxID=54092 RepID=A0AAD7VNY3_9ASCO|nr:uncharacterized protein POJ06DRAFT_262246 [Lipomyces tetrasporus]KAJ8097012.1 hypothetical protein POJ06DRAFT_262246 [Lipomyces tetrasporus]
MASAENDDDIPVTRSDLGQTVSRFAVTPYPAWAFSASLFGTVPRASSVKMYLPRPLSCVFFGSVIAFGGYIINDNDVINGAGFTSAWSIMYLLANGKRGLTQFRPWPAFLSTWACGNALMYGREYFFPDSDRTRL